MKRLYNKLILGALTGITLSAGFTACTNDHFDINQNVQSKVSLWETINSQENLTEFANILKQVKYSKSEGTTTVQTYADLFNNDQTFTVWAPANGTFNYFPAFFCQNSLLFIFCYFYFAKFNPFLLNFSVLLTSHKSPRFNHLHIFSTSTKNTLKTHLKSLKKHPKITFKIV